MLEQLLAGSLAEEQVSELEQHLDFCEECQGYLEQATSPQNWTADLFAPESSRLDPSMRGAFAGDGLRLWSGNWALDRAIEAVAMNPLPPCRWPIVGSPAVAGTGTDSLSRWLAAPEIDGYDVMDRIGGGLASEVYRARERIRHRIVALKIPGVRTLQSDAGRDRFVREARILARLNHPGIVAVHDIGESSGRPFIAMEYVEGPTLAQAAAGRPQAPARAAALCEHLAHAIQQAHENGLIHRDLKPSNVLLQSTPDPAAPDASAQPGPGEPGLTGTPRIIDFGLARDLRADESLTVEHEVLGTPGYMAPEQVRGQTEAIGPATDVYGLGAILYQLLTGHPPFHKESPLQTLRAVSDEEPLPIDRLRPGVPRDLITICQKCLEKDPDRRYRTAAALADDLRRWREGRPISSRPPGPLGRAQRWVRRKPTLAALLGLTAAVVLVLTVGGPLLAFREAQRRLATERLARSVQREQANAMAERDRANANFNLARSVVAEMTDLLVVRRAQLRPSSGSLQIEALLQEVASRFHDRFAALQSQDQQVELDRLDGMVRLAMLRRQQQSDDWAALIDQAITGYERMDREGRLPVDRQSHWVMALTQRADHRFLNRDPEGGRRVNALALDRARKYAAAQPDSKSAAVLLARVSLADALDAPQVAIQIEALEGLRTRLRPMRSGPIWSPQLEQEWAFLCESLGRILLQANRSRDAEEPLRESLETLALLVESEPTSLENLERFIRVIVALVPPWRQDQRWAEIVTACDRVLERGGRQRVLLARVPWPIMHELLTARIEALMQLGQYARMERACAEALPLAGYQSMLLRFQLSRARALVRLGQAERAVGLVLDVTAESKLPPLWLPEAAEVLALASESIAPPAENPAAVAFQSEQAERWSRQAIALLVRIRPAPGSSPGAIRAAMQDVELDALKQRPDFQAWERDNGLLQP